MNGHFVPAPQSRGIAPLVCWNIGKVEYRVGKFDNIFISRIVRIFNAMLVVIQYGADGAGQIIFDHRLHNKFLNPHGQRFFFGNIFIKTGA